MKSFKEFLTEAGKDNYYKIGGDPWDGGVVLKVYVGGKEVFSAIRDGDHDWKYKNKSYSHIDKLIGTIAKENGLALKDLKRIELD